MTKRPPIFQRGQALTEFALVLPLLIVLVLALFDFGMLLYAHVQVANAAREGARAASLYRTTRYANESNYTTPWQCTSGVDGWSILDTARQAIVARSLTNKGCPNANGTITSSSLGWLDPAPTLAWGVRVTPAQSGNDMPTAGLTATVALSYPYRLPIISTMVPGLFDPVWIQKSVNFEYHP